MVKLAEGFPRSFGLFVFMLGATSCSTAPEDASVAAAVVPLVFGATEDARLAGASGSYFGSSVANAGDVNGDGYNDLLVGDFTFGGQVFLYLGSATGLSTTPVAWDPGSIVPDGVQFALAVAGGGDVDGDGCADVLVSAPDYGAGSRTNLGAVFVFFGHGVGCGDSESEPVLNTTDYVRLDSTSSAYAEFGFSLDGVGDVNGDGLADFAVGAPGDDVQGVVHVYLGSADRMFASSLPIQPTQAGMMRFGSRVAHVGDVDGDGFDDILASAPEDGGYVFLFKGASLGPTSTAAWTYSGSQGASERAGDAIAGGVDVNGDFAPDIFVASLTLEQVLVFAGGASMSTTPLTTLTSTEVGSTSFGSALEAAGDVNGDGFGDVIIGAPGGASHAQLHLGSPSGLTTAISWFAPSNDGMGNAISSGDFNADGYSDIVLGASSDDFVSVYHGGYVPAKPDRIETAGAWQIEGNIAEANIGRSMAFGDFSGDGFPDLIVGGYASNNSAVPSVNTSVYVIPNTTGRFSAQTSGQPISAYAGAVTLSSPDSRDGFGVVANAGDVNGDGYEDAIVGVINGTLPGAWIYLGSEASLSDARRVRIAVPSEDASLFGTSVASAGDINDDGYADVLVGAPGSDAVYVVYGRAQTSVDADTTWTHAEKLAAGTIDETDEFGLILAGVGDVNGDNFDDFAIGSTPDNTSTDTTTMEGATVYVYFGNVNRIDPELRQAIVVHGNNADGGGPCTTLSRMNALSIAGGDVDGDGHADVLIGEPWYNTCRGRVAIYNGYSGAVGMLSVSTPEWTLLPPSGAGGGSIDGLTNIGFGSSLGLGDINDDGFGDLLVGAQLEDRYATGFSMSTSATHERGRVYQFHGSMTGPSTSPVTFVGNDVGGVQTYVGRGLTIPTADVDRDGFADFAVSKVRSVDSGQEREGRVNIITGCTSSGMSGHWGPVYAASAYDYFVNKPLHRSTTGGVIIGMRLWSPMGRTIARLQFEVKPLGTAFTGTGLVNDAFSQATDATSAAYFVTGTAVSTNYHWRARLQYTTFDAETVAGAGARSISTSRWMYGPAFHLPPVRFVPDEVGVGVHTNHTLLARGGSRSYTYQLVSGSSTSSVTPEGEYTAGTRGTDLVRVTDRNGLQATLTITVVGETQSITFEPTSAGRVGDVITLEASSTSMLPVTFSVVSGPATILGDQLTLTGVGDVVVRASQGGADLIEPASDVDRTITVSAALPMDAGVVDMGAADMDAVDVGIAVDAGVVDVVDATVPDMSIDMAMPRDMGTTPPPADMSTVVLHDAAPDAADAEADADAEPPAPDASTGRIRGGGGCSVGNTSAASNAFGMLALTTMLAWTVLSRRRGRA